MPRARTWWKLFDVTVKGFAFIISYSDADGGQRFIAHADVKRFGTSRPDVRCIAIFREGETEPFVVSEPPSLERSRDARRGPPR
jgi:hypothetical protein